MNRNEIFEFVKSKYNTDPEYLWLKTPDAAVLRNTNGKWYGIIMNIPLNRLGLKSDKSADVLVVKSEPLLIDMLLQQKGCYPAYHMNKKNWISILLNGDVKASDIKNLLSESRRLSAKSKNVKG